MTAHEIALALALYALIGALYWITALLDEIEQERDARTHADNRRPD